MQLTSEQMLSLLFGWAEIAEENGGLRGYKCTAQIRENWGKTAEFLKTHASHSTGIRMDFHTDSDMVSFTVSGGKFEIKTDGITAVRAVTDGKKPTEISVDLPSGEHRVTLIFPTHGNGIVYGSEVSDGASVRPHEFKEKIHFLGDSITQGWNAEWDSLCYALQVSEFFDADCLIHGVGGGFFHPSFFEKAPFDPDRVIVALGTNDFSWGNSADQIRTYVSAYLDSVVDAYGTEKVTGILPIWRSEESKPEALRNLYGVTMEILRKEYGKRGIRTVDGLRLVPHSAEFFREDGLHPNDLGFSHYAIRLIQALQNN